MQEQKSDDGSVERLQGTLQDSGSPVDEVTYLQQLLDHAHGEIAEYKRGFIGETRRPLLMELIVLAQAVEIYLGQHGDSATADDYRDFLESAVLGDIRQALIRYGVEPYICAPGSVDRRLQKVVRVEDIDDVEGSGHVQPLARGYADTEGVLQKEQVILYRARNDRA